MTSSWQVAWESAQPRLSAIRDSLATQSSPDSRVIRVGQVDSELLDQELVYLLQEPLNKAIALLNSSLKARYEPELTLLIQLALYKLSIWNSGASYGAKLQDLKYVARRKAGWSLCPSGLPRRTLLLHGSLTILLPYFHNRIRSHALSRAWPDAPSSDPKRKAWEMLTSLESSHTVLALLSFVAFLWNGRYRTIADRILNMRLVPSTKLVRRDVSYEFMNRQMVWHAFTEFLLFFLPLISARTIRRRVNHIFSGLTLTSVTSLLPSRAHFALGIKPSQSAPDRNRRKHGKYWSLPRDQCAICAENASYGANLSDSANAFRAVVSAPPFSPTNSPDVTPFSETEPPAYPIHTPYTASCGDVFCYHCITERMMRAADEDEEDAWECLRCGGEVRAAERLVVRYGSESESGVGDYEFSSDVDATDLSGSVGSYSELGMLD